MIRALCVAPDIRDNQSAWRCAGPLGYLAAERSDFDYVSPANLSWLETVRCSFLFLQRPFSQQHLQILQFCNWYGLPSVLDFDDLLWSIPKGNPAWITYDDRWKAMATECVKQADCVIASTEPIGRYVSSLGASRVEVIENALPTHYKWFSRPRQKKILWRGSDFHRHDIDSVADDLIAVINDNPDWHVVFTGGDPYHVTKRIKHTNFSIRPLMIISDFHGMLIDEAPAIIINPLQDHPFNHAKSNIAWIESCIAGSVLVAPDFPQYQLPGCVRYQQGEFGETLLRAMKEIDTIPGRAKEARAYCDQEYRLPAKNARRLELFREICGRKP